MHRLNRQLTTKVDHDNAHQCHICCYAFTVLCCKMHEIPIPQHKQSNFFFGPVGALEIWICDFVVSMRFRSSPIIQLC